MPNYAIQEQNQDMLSLLSSQFRLLYNPAHAFADAVAMLQALPGIRGIWPSSAVGASGQMQDISGNGLHLTNNNVTRFGSVDNLAPFTVYNGTNQYFNRASEAAFQITGTEAYILNPGLTMGGWFYFNETASAPEAMVYKVNNTDRNYYMQRRTAGNIQFAVYNSNLATTVNSLDVLDEDTWYFVAGRFDPSTELKVWVNGNTVINTTSIPASIDTDAADFTIGASGVPGLYMNGRTSLSFLCASMLSDAHINAFYQMTAPLFGISV